MAAPAGLSATLLRHWAQPRLTLLTTALWPVGQAMRLLVALRRQLYHRGVLASWRAPVPVLVVGNLILGGAGKTPTVLTLVPALRALGWTPGVVSRGHGRARACVVVARDGSSAAELGDEPALLHRRLQVPLAVGADRVAAAQALLKAHPEVDVLLSDDGLQHLRLQRDAALVLFDARGAGNGQCLPAGPLREPLPRQLDAHAQVLYTHGTATTHLPGHLGGRHLAGALPLRDWWSGAAPQPLSSLREGRWTAAAGIAQPEGFFAMLRAAGLDIQPLELPDHARLDALPWRGTTGDVVVTEKDAIKLNPARPGCEAVWVAILKSDLPPALIDALDHQLRQSRPS
ncbi:MAG: tetraacyldisaccharide 4'-kinase [Aquabacterium sp.]